MSARYIVRVPGTGYVDDYGQALRSRRFAYPFPDRLEAELWVEANQHRFGPRLAVELEAPLRAVPSELDRLWPLDPRD